MTNNNILPQFKAKQAIVFAADDNYAPVLSVALISLFKHISKNNEYDIVILISNISEENKNALLSLNQHKNATIRIFDISSFLQKYNKNIFFTSNHISISTYYRIFIPELLSDYDKVLYLDCDIIVLCDVAKLLSQDLQGNMVAAVNDCTQNTYIQNAFSRYIKETLKLDISKYFNSGVMLFDIKTCCQADFVNNALSFLAEIKIPRSHDQDILNKVCSDRVLYLDASYNFQWHLPFCYPETYASKDFAPHKTEYEQARANVKIIHYTTGTKPWNDASKDLSLIWWDYAKQSYFYERFLLSLMDNKLGAVRNALALKQLKYKAWFYKFLYHIVSGELREFYRNKCCAAKARYRAAKVFIKG